MAAHAAPAASAAGGGVLGASVLEQLPSVIAAPQDSPSGPTKAYVRQGTVCMCSMHSIQAAGGVGAMSAMGLLLIGAAGGQCVVMHQVSGCSQSLSHLVSQSHM